MPTDALPDISFPEKVISKLKALNQRRRGIVIIDGADSKPFDAPAL